MFEKIRVRWAISQALASMQTGGDVPRETWAYMDRTANHILHATFGAQLLVSGAAVNRHAAAAAVFAQLAAAAERTPDIGLATADDWVDAGVVAMVNAGAKPSDARRIVMQLIG
jgi:hypothetical protein